MSAEYFSVLRQQMLAEIAAETIYVSARLGKAALDDRVMAVMGEALRHEYVPIELQPYAYVNMPLPIGFGKTISQPFIVALMTDLLDIRPDDTVLEIGTGLGYQAAILAELARKLYSVEIIEELARQAKRRLDRQGYRNIELRVGNGYYGWPKHAPFDKVIVTAAPDHPRVADPPAEGGRQNGDPRRLARGAATRPGRERPPGPGDDEGNPAGAILGARGS